MMDNNNDCQVWVDAKSRQLPTDYLHEQVHYLYGTHLQPAQNYLSSWKVKFSSLFFKKYFEDRFGIFLRKVQM